MNSVSVLCLNTLQSSTLEEFRRVLANDEVDCVVRKRLSRFKSRFQASDYRMWHIIPDERWFCT